LSGSNPTPTDIARLGAAGDWVQRLYRSSDPAVVEEWMRWCGEDPRNFIAFEQMQVVWEGFPQPVAAPATAPAFMAQPHGPLTRRNWLLGLAAGVLVMVGAIGWLAQRYSQVQSWVTAPGEQYRDTLPDGSHLDLAPDSRLSIRFSLLEREVRLERGEAYFGVAHNALRPFVVTAVGLTATAVGTAFDVRTGPDATAVTVSAGWVRIAPVAYNDRADVAAAPFRAHAGQRVTLLAAAKRLSVAQVDLGAAESWRNGVLEFVGQPLQDVVGEVDRFVKRRIILAASLQNLRFTGTVSPGKLEDWLEALKLIYAVEVVDEGTNGIHILAHGHDSARKRR